MLYPSFSSPEKWRNEKQRRWIESDSWKRLRKNILNRDSYTCAYCEYRSDKYQIVDHIDGDPENNKETNLQAICQMCNLVKHSGQGCVIVGVVNLYKKSNFTQNKIISITRNMRDKGAVDGRIIRYLGLDEKVSFKQNMGYLKGLYGFVTSRPSLNSDDMYSKWLRYHESNNQFRNDDKLQRRLRPAEQG